MNIICSFEKQNKQEKLYPKQNHTKKYGRKRKNLGEGKKTTTIKSEVGKLSGVDLANKCK